MHKPKKIIANKEFIEFYQTQNQRDFKKLEYILDGLKNNGLNNEGLIREIILSINPVWYAYKVLEKRETTAAKVKELWKDQIQDVYIRNHLKVILACCLINIERFSREKPLYISAAEVLETLIPIFPRYGEVRKDIMYDTLKTVYTKLNEPFGKWLEETKGLIYRLTHERFPGLFSKYIISKSRVQEAYENSMHCLEEKLKQRSSASDTA